MRQDVLAGAVICDQYAKVRFCQGAYAVALKAVIDRILRDFSRSH